MNLRTGPAALGTGAVLLLSACSATPGEEPAAAAPAEQSAPTATSSAGLGAGVDGAAGDGAAGDGVVAGAGGRAAPGSSPAVAEQADSSKTAPMQGPIASLRAVGGMGVLFQLVRVTT